MREYPSIPRCPMALNVDAHIFVKYDGSNLRFEWNRKSGWYKFGTRHRMIDKNDRAFGSAIPLFKKTIGDDIADTLRSRWPGARSFIVFCEYFGRHSFAGQHVADDPKEFKLFDVNPFQQGIIGPADFLDTFGTKPYAAKWLGRHKLTPEYIESIRNAENIDDYHYEGVIAKWGERHNLQMTKIKTLRYLNDLKLRLGEDWEKYE